MSVHFDCVRSITTTEEHYGHLEISFVREAAASIEALSHRQRNDCIS
jgi:hypothetical protein